MNREEQDRALHRILKEAGEISKSIESPSVRILAGAIAFLVVIIDSQSRRLDALEYCKASDAPGMSHRWIDVGPRILCQYCGVERA
jgi:hypothetical protein